MVAGIAGDSATQRQRKQSRVVRLHFGNGAMSTGTETCVGFVLWTAPSMVRNTFPNSWRRGTACCLRLPIQQRLLAARSRPCILAAPMYKPAA